MFGDLGVFLDLVLTGFLEGMVVGGISELLDLGIIGWGNTGMDPLMGGGDLFLHRGENGSGGTDPVAE